MYSTKVPYGIKKIIYDTHVRNIVQRSVGTPTVSSTTSNPTSPINNRMARKRQTKKKATTTTNKKSKGTKLNYQREV